MTEERQLELVQLPAVPQLTARQRLAYDYLADSGNDGVTADEVGAWLHAHRPAKPHSIDERCEWCGRDGNQVLRSKALRPLVTFRRGPLGRRYLLRDRKARRVQGYDPATSDWPEGFGDAA